MTNYNKKLDDVLSAVYLAGTENGLDRRLTDAQEIMHRKEAFIKGNPASKKAKQALTSLIKELVAEAKPKYQAFTRDMVSRGEVKRTIDEFEQNLLKALSNNGKAE